MALTKVIGNGLGAVTQDGAATFNEGSADVDFRVESNGNTHMLFVQAGSDCLGIKTASPNDYYADDLVLTVPDEGGMTFVTGTTHANYISFADGTSGNAAYRGFLKYDHNNDRMTFGTSGNSAIEVDSTGAVTKPLQPAFLVQPASAQNNMSVGSNITIVFGTEIYDQNGDFSSNTFTAPVTGKYQLSFALRVDQLDAASDYYNFFFETSNRSYFYLFEPNLANDGADITRFPAVLSILADMDANDTVTVRMFQQSGSAVTDIITDSYFSGYLVC